MVKLALVGCGGMAHAHAQAFRRIENCSVVALVDPITDRTASYREKYFSEAAEYESFDAMLEDSKKLELDGVVLVTPHTVHYPHAKAALEKGLHVLVEKPMVTSSKHAYDLWKTVKKTGKLLAIAFQSCYTPEFNYLSHLRDSGEWGTVQVISGYLSQGWLNGTRNTWRQDPALSGGGQMYDSGAHLFNAIMWLMNEPVVEVGCFYNTCGSPVDINGVVIAKFQSGALASMTVGGACPSFKSEIQIQTDKMLIHCSQYGTELKMFNRHGTVYPHVSQNFDAGPTAGTPQQNFIDAITGESQPCSPVRYGVLQSTLMDALYESADTGKFVKVEPVPKDI